MWDERLGLAGTAPPAILVWISSPVLSVRSAFRDATCPPIAFPESLNGLRCRRHRLFVSENELHNYKRCCQADKTKVHEALSV